MAKAIQVDFPVRDHKAELQMRLAEAPTEHAAAILELLELLDVLHERNVLSTIRGAVGAGDDLIGHVSPPYGTDLLVAIVSSEPLFAGRRRNRFVLCATCSPHSKSLGKSIPRSSRQWADRFRPSSEIAT